MRAHTQLQGCVRGGPQRICQYSRQQARSQLRVRAQAGQAPTVPVTVTVKKKVDLGEKVNLVGNLKALGDWNPNEGPSLKWHEGHNWQMTLNVPVGTEVNFKAVHVRKDGSNEWENGENRTFTPLGPDYSLDIQCKWNETHSTRIKANPLSGASSNGHSSNGSSNMDRLWANAGSNGNGRYGSGSDSDTGSGGSTRIVGLSSLEEDARSTSAWVGNEPKFVRSRIQQDRQGNWRTDGLGGVELEVVQGDQKASDWLGKLGLMKYVLVDRPHMMRPNMEELTPCYIYATWINTGAIACVETGGHRRPNNHANAALQMFRSLEWAISDAGMGNGGGSSPEARMLVARRLVTRLPSFSGEFRASVPLTRIRDIAHRNDIPQDLKQEIKHTLQNKIHRSAGPEDLVATEAMLQRITANPGQYPEAFVNEFRIFSKELREFFSASGLLDLLNQTYDSLEDRHKGIVNQFKEAMSRLDSAGQDPNMDDIMAGLFMGTQARGYYVSGLSAGLRNDVNDDVLSMRQRWRLAEVRIEDYVFVLLSRVISVLESAGGAKMMARPNSASAWRFAGGALIQGLRQLGLSGYATQELLVLENEIESWLSSFASGGSVAQRENALRGKACVERVQRLSSQFSDMVMSLYNEPAKRLGNGLGVPQHMSHIFGESEVRASVTFQVSRLAGLMAKALREVAVMDAWDGLVTGDVEGRLVLVDGLSPEVMDQACSGHDDPVILLARGAEGDEEVGSLGPRLAGVVLCQELPHLSHLGVRARQEKCTFATCDDEEYLNRNVRPLINKYVRLTVTPEGVTLKETAPSGKRHAHHHAKAEGHDGRKAASARAGQAGSASMSTTHKVTSVSVVPLDKATVDRCGSKAAKCADLQRVAKTAGKALFSTPPGVVLPFGCMDVVIEECGKTQEYQACVSALEDPSLTGSALDRECVHMADMIRQCRLNDNTLREISSAFQPGALVAVRSSANVEDLAGMSAAGLYESKVGVRVKDLDELNTAVCDVWASLYTRRAVLSRRQAGVGQTSASMAVLIMELVAPELSFVLHTARPRDNNANILLAEIAPGQGETLASGTRGTPWRMEIDKSTSKVDTLAFANFSKALVVPSAVPPSLRGRVGRALRYSSFDEQHGSRGGAAVASHEGDTHSGLVEVEVDYSKQRLSTDSSYREQVARQLARVGMLVESHYGKEAQDIEGGLVPAAQDSHQLNVVLFQTRPQH